MLDDWVIQQREYIQKDSHTCKLGNTDGTCKEDPASVAQRPIAL